MLDSKEPTVLVADTNENQRTQTRQTLARAGFAVTTADGAQAVLEQVYAAPPQCLLVEHHIAREGRTPLLAELRADNVYGHLPVILMISREELATGVDWSEQQADDFLVRPLAETELVSRVRLCLARAHRDIETNPLSGLPGNLTIMREAERRIRARQDFAMAYLDVDGFKAFNDRYGFTRGDEVLRMTARIIVNAIRDLESEDTYVGHVGGDDFVFLAPVGLVRGACDGIVQDFDRIVPSFYDEEDRTAGEIRSLDRKGNEQRYPLLTISIAVVDTETAQVEHVADLSARIAEVKKFVKQLSGSNVFVDRRR